jgi:hypothetical protein
MGTPTEFLAWSSRRRIARVGFVVCAFALAATSVFAQGTSAPGILKVCKVAGPGVAVGGSFTFTATAGSNPTPIPPVPAGPAPGGTCMVGPSFPVSTPVTVVETSIPAGATVSSITVAPPGQQVGSPNGGSVTITIGSGVTEVTFTNKRTGFLEICKTGGATGAAGPYSFTITPSNNPGNLNLGPFVVPAGACSPAIEVAAGPVTINELPPATMANCTTTPPTNQINPCGTQGDMVTVVPGDVSTMTIATITNK